ncbi:MAG: hypothetical protein Q8S13_12385 [Dehalococcoidia bacterium]|nr:hypothetical protein [Dehalococcoidia bacterium]
MMDIAIEPVMCLCCAASSNGVGTHGWTILLIGAAPSSAMTDAPARALYVCPKHDASPTTVRAFLSRLPTKRKGRL